MHRRLPPPAHSIAIAVLVALALGGCAGPRDRGGGPPRHGQQAGDATAADSAQRGFAARGYNPARQVSWHEEGVTLTLPAGATRAVVALPEQTRTRAPLVLYLPGLGEPASAGERWRHAWATSGVAVLSLQALEADANAFRSDLARGGEFAALGRQRYGAAAMNERVLALRAALAEIDRRAQALEQPFARIDTSRVVVAGFDLGAYTAMVLAGEQVPGVAASVSEPRVGAVLAISPYADLAAGGLASRYLGVGVPALSISGDNDGDPLGLVASPTQRQVPHAQIKSADNWLLWLYGLNHARLSGRSAGEANDRAAVEPAAGGEPPADARGGNRGSRGSRGRRTEGGDALAGERGSAIDPGAALTAVEQVSVAFLDAYAQRDDMARAWLSERAPGWLQGVGELRR
ncbi:MAG TPA: hypothetical protein VML58_03070 [Burkholderiaceae bacterium]|nr:hypothetical protein [Burkholderiaceae bacterium]